MGLPRKNDADSIAYWTMIDQAAERVRQIAERQPRESSALSEARGQAEREAPRQDD